MDRDKSTVMDLFLPLTFTVLVAPSLVASQVNSTLFVSKGCFYDNFEYDVLPDLIKCDNDVHQTCLSACNTERPYCQSNNMTVDLCFRICTNQNARYFGLQDGSQCLCGGAFAPYDSQGAPPNDLSCSKNCTGDPAQACGGSFTIIVYEIKDPTSDCFHPGFLNVREEFFPPVDQDVFHVNDTLEYNTICQSPSNLTGTPTITCTENNWSEPPPACTIRCSPTGPMPYVVFEPVTAESFGVGETVSYICLGNTTTFTTECDRRGLWVPADCPVTCPRSDLPIGGALRSTPNLDYFAVGALVDFVCGTTPLSATFECEGSGRWNTSSFTCPEAAPTTSSPLTTPTNAGQPSTADIVEGTMSGLETTESTTGEVEGPREPIQEWVIAVAVIVPLLVIILLIVVICCCYRKRKEEQSKHVPQVVLGYIKKRGTIGGTLKRNRDPEKNHNDNPEGDSADIKKGGTLTHSLSSMKQQFVKRVTLNRNRPELPPKKNPKKFSSRSVTSNVEAGYVSPKEVRTASEADVQHPNPPPTKRASTISILSPVDNGLDEVFKSELRTSRSSEMLDALMVEFDGRVNHGFDNEESSARSSPSLASKNSPKTERVVIHSPRPSSPKAETPKENGLQHDTEENGENEFSETTFSSTSHPTDVKDSNDEDKATEFQPDLPEYASVNRPKAEDSTAVSNGDYLEESPYDSLGEPKPAPPEVLNVNGGTVGVDSHQYESTIDRKRPAPITLNGNGRSDYAALPGPESPQYASLADVQSPNGGVGAMGSPESTTTTMKHDYVNVGRGNSVSATRMSAEFHHPRPPSLPPDSP